MRRFLIQRAIWSLGAMIIVSMVVFVLARAQGDPRTLYVEEDLPQEAWDAMGRRLGLDRPLPIQYAIFLRQLATFDLGVSIHQRRPVSTIVAEKIPATLKLAAGGFLFSVMVGLPLGILSAVKRGSIWDYIGRTFAVLGQSLPSFWVAVIGILIFSVHLGWVPPFGSETPRHWILPSVALGWAAAGGQLRMVRSSMLGVMDSEYVKLARAKGASESRVIWKHALRNALLAPLTFAGLTLASLITGSIIIENVFSWPGLGYLALGAVRSSDYAVLQGVMVVITFFYIFVSFLVDMLYAVVDPRIRYG